MEFRLVGYARPFTAVGFPPQHRAWADFQLLGDLFGSYAVAHQTKHLALSARELNHRTGTYSDLISSAQSNLHTYSRFYDRCTFDRCGKVGVYCAFWRFEAICALNPVSSGPIGAHHKRSYQMSAPEAISVLESLLAVDVAMHSLLISTLRHEHMVAERDREIAAIHKARGPAIDKAAIEQSILEAQIQVYCRVHPECFEEGKKSVQLTNGLMGLRTSNPSLEPLNKKWTWELIEAKLRELWKSKYFHKPKPPGIDKTKLKKGLDAAQLKECGLKLETYEGFYLELNRLAAPAQLEYEAAAQ